MDIRSTRLLRKLHEWLSGEPVYSLMREDRDSMLLDLRCISAELGGNPCLRAGEMLSRISALKAETVFGQACVRHAHELGIDPSKELGQQYRSIRRDAEDMRALRQTKLGRVFLRLTKGVGK